MQRNSPLIKEYRPEQQGFSLIELLIVIAVIGIIAAIGTPSLLAARRNANEGSAISSVRVIVSAQFTYRSTGGTQDYAPGLTELHNLNTIDSQLAGGAKSGYNFTTQSLAPAAGYPARFDVTATPLAFGTVLSTGNYSYYANEAGVIYRLAAGTAPVADPLTRVIASGEPLN